MGSWIEQLIAESTGKEGKGIIPIVGEELGDPSSYGDDRLFVGLGEDKQLRAFAEAGHPVIQIDFSEQIALGSELYRWEFATAVAGHILGINPFDQPNVQSAKDATKSVLSTGELDQPSAGDLEQLAASIRKGDYLAILAYLDRNPENEKVLQRVRLALRDRHRVATTLGFGPRYLHSTGQLHKGGPDSGVFIEVVDPDLGEDIGIPDATFTFRDLIRAQALGDYKALEDAGRRVARVTLDQLKEVIP